MELDRSSIHIDREVIRKVLTYDMYCRKIRHWPLIKYTDGMAYTMSKMDVDIANDIISMHVNRNMDHQKVDHAHFLIRIPDMYKRLDVLLRKFRGEIYVCGGFVSRIINNAFFSYSGDADIFFVGVSEQRAEYILQQCLDLIQLNESNNRSNYRHCDCCDQQYNDDSNDDDNNYHYTIMRNEYVTTIKTPENAKYQFIHRIYDRLDLVLGGFDIPYASIAWDGEDIWMIPTAVFCQMTNSVIIDVSRRSTTYESRIVKYAKTYNIYILFPGTSKEFISSVCPEIMCRHHGIQFPFLTITMHRHNFYPHDNDHYHKYSMISRSAAAQKGTMLVKEVNDDTELTQHHDYGDDGGSTEKYTQKRITIKYILSGKLDYVSTFSYISSDMLNHTVLKLDAWKKKDLIYAFERWPYHTCCRMFGKKFVDEVIHLIATDTLDTQVEKYLAVINIKIKRGHELVSSNRRQIKWRTQNPGTQWTSSINPVMTNPRDWYGRFYESFWIGIPEHIETYIRLAHLKRINVLGTLPKDILRLILRCVAEMYADEGLDVCLSGNQKIEFEEPSYEYSNEYPNEDVVVTKLEQKQTEIVMQFNEFLRRNPELINVLKDHLK